MKYLENIFLTKFNYCIGCFQTHFRPNKENKMQNCTQDEQFFNMDDKFSII